jgi:thiol-disulfide isomerase/thioredoxin
MFDSLGNQFSFVLFSLAAVVGVVVLLRVLRRGWRLTTGAGLVVAAAALVIFFALRPGLSDVDSVQAAESMLQNGKPTMLEFFSNFCTNCLAARPQVDALIRDIQAQHGEGVNVLRIDIHTNFGRDLRERYGFSYTPEFILFNRGGQEIWRAHVPPTLAQIDDAMSGGLASNSDTPNQ